MHLQDINYKEYFLKIYNNYFMKDVWIAYGLGFKYYNLFYLLIL